MESEAIKPNVEKQNRIRTISIDEASENLDPANKAFYRVQSEIRDELKRLNEALGVFVDYVRRLP